MIIYGCSCYAHAGLFDSWKYLRPASEPGESGWDSLCGLTYEIDNLFTLVSLSGLLWVQPRRNQAWVSRHWQSSIFRVQTLPKCPSLKLDQVHLWYLCCTSLQLSFWHIRLDPSKPASKHLPHIAWPRRRSWVAAKWCPVDSLLRHSYRILWESINCNQVWQKFDAVFLVNCANCASCHLNTLLHCLCYLQNSLVCDILWCTSILILRKPWCRKLSQFHPAPPFSGDAQGQPQQPGQRLSLPMAQITRFAVRRTLIRFNMHPWPWNARCYNCHVSEMRAVYDAIIVSKQQPFCSRSSTMVTTVCRCFGSQHRFPAKALMALKSGTFVQSMPQLEALTAAKQSAGA